MPSPTTFYISSLLYNITHHNTTMAESSSTTTSMTTAPLLQPRQNSGELPSTPPAGALAQLLGRASGRRGASMLVRETAARTLEQRRADWGYSKPVVALDMLWNMAFVVVSIVMLMWTTREKTNTPIRLWICGYAVQCLVHVVLVWLEFRRRRVRRVRDGERQQVNSDGDQVIGSDHEDGERQGLANLNRSSAMKRFESLNTMVSFLWWILGFYWVVSGGEMLLQNAPRLYWLAVVFLAFDVFFAIFCVVLACLIGIALCCCLPCLIAILYAVAGQEGASESDLCILPKYVFQALNNEEKTSVAAGKMVPAETNSASMEHERVLLQEDAECCICLCSYEDGVELNVLPCNHHFHSSCIVKWLKMNATCPLCKYNILKGNEQV